jgi:hypothetical protein
VGLDFMSEQIQISYSLPGTGWSKCMVETGHARTELSASYLSDALGNLVLSAITVASGFQTVEFGFDKEPGEYRWSICGMENNAIEVRIVEFQSRAANQATEMGRVLLSGITTRRDFARAVHLCATSVLDEYGVKGYAEKWAAHPFPERTLHLLGEAIADWE